VICTDGELRVGPAGAEETLRAGDALHFRADVAHTYESRSGAVVVCVLSTAAVPT
jgi:quercetin dioxygenase-like cupin family protein